MPFLTCGPVMTRHSEFATAKGGFARFQAATLVGLYLGHYHAWAYQGGF